MTCSTAVKLSHDSDGTTTTGPCMPESSPLHSRRLAAQMVELVDTRASEARAREGVRVRAPRRSHGAVPAGCRQAVRARHVHRPPVQGVAPTPDGPCRGRGAHDRVSADPLAQWSCSSLRTCAGRDSNPHVLADPGSLGPCVDQFHHLRGGLAVLIKMHREGFEPSRPRGPGHLGAGCLPVPAPARRSIS